MDCFVRGFEDIYREIIITDGDGTVLDADLFLTIEVIVKHKKHIKRIGTYTLAGSEVVVESGDDGIISLIIPKEDTEDKPVGVYVYQIKTTETDADYPDSVRTRTLEPTDCFYLKGAIT